MNLSSQLLRLVENHLQVFCILSLRMLCLHKCQVTDEKYFRKSRSEEVPSNLGDCRMDSTELLLFSLTRNFEAGPLSVPNRFLSTTRVMYYNIIIYNIIITLHYIIIIIYNIIITLYYIIIIFKYINSVKIAI